MSIQPLPKEVYEQQEGDLNPVDTATTPVATSVPAAAPTPVTASSTSTKKPLTLSYLNKRNSEKPLIKVEVSDLLDGETLVCYRRSNMPAVILENLRSKGEDRNTLKTLLDAVSDLTLDEQGNPLGTREEWAQFDIDILNTILTALFESSNKVGEA